MANWDNHLKQAQHNERLAAQMEANPDLKHWDWLITIAFYAAVHYVEAAFFFTNIGHTEQACQDGDMHAFRARNVQVHLDKDSWKSYRKLQNASYNVRYLALAQQQPTDIAIHYYSLADAKQFFTTHLAQVRETVLKKLAQ